MSLLHDKETDISGSKAVIYCRVSSSKQTKVGDGLGSQQTRCNEYARYKGLHVVKTFTDDMSGPDYPAISACGLMDAMEL
jgi:predicted site-specific integrase-resolvase